jgi:Fe-S-cluster-containing dehydrogenase component/formate-dependent nitrite reductase membrane component NrfD
MMRYGFVIDQDRCIGCHACTVACKEEHSVPIGVFRTWVKYIEKGAFPDTSRHFGVLRCNHCDNAPCIEICPTTALFRRDNGIVDFDADRCIGCKSCMQACPYDALYIDPETHTAAKCNFCAHRVELNLEPSCVIVCPTQAIIAGDLDDDTSRIGKIVATQKTLSRKPHKGTEPKLFYIGIEGDLLSPARLLQQPSHLWAEKQPGENDYDAAHRYNALAGAGGISRASQAREVYDVAHPAPWGWRIAAYLWTKSIASGLLLVAAFLIGFGFDPKTPALSSIASGGALIFVGVTTFLLVIDLKRPLRFFYIITKPNFGSWVVIGTYILILYGALALAWFGYSVATSSVPPAIVFLSASAAVACACYSAFLFAQAKGRDFWQSPLLFWHLLVQAVVAGAASLRLIASVTGDAAAMIPSLDKVVALSLLVALMMMTIEVTIPPIGEDVHYATDLLIRGKLKFYFIIGAIGLGTAIPALILSIAFGPPFQEPARIVACVLALAGLFVFEDLWVRAGQAPPLS